MRLVSLGAGWQSTALCLMAAEGIVADVDGAVFADTQWEPEAVYGHLSQLILYCAAYGLPVYRTSKGNIRDDALDNGKRFASMPLYTRNASGEVGQLRRQCTSEYKIAMIYRKARELLGQPNGTPPPGSVEMLVGISLDEAHRMKPARPKYIRNRWPLIEAGMTRDDCCRFNESRGFYEVPKSACVGCPYTDRARWRDMKLNRPEEFEDAVDFDESIRRSARFETDAAYLLREAIPLKDADFRNEEDAGQLAMFDAECEGMCGV